MITYTKKQLKNLVECGVATDLTRKPQNELPRPLEKIGIVNSKYGIGGLLLKNEKNELFAITSRSGNVYYY